MKHFVTLIMTLFLAVGAGAQVTYPSTFVKHAPNMYYGQMLNVSNTYPNATNDTATNSTALYLCMAKRTTAGLAAVTPVYEPGALTVMVTGIKISGTVAGTVTLEQSANGTDWATVILAPQIPVSTTSGTVTTTYTGRDFLTLADVATAQTYSWYMPILTAPYYRVAVKGSGSQTSSWKAFFFYQRKN